MPTITIALPAAVTELQAEPFERVAGASGQVPQTVSLTGGAGSIVVAATGANWCWKFTECGPGYRKTRFCIVVGAAAYGALTDLDPGTLTTALTPSSAAWESIANAAAAAVAGKVDKGALSFNVLDYGAFGTWTGVTGSDDTAGINAAFAARDAAGGGGEVYFPPRPAGQRYRYLGTFPTASGLVMRGVNRNRTRIDITGYDAFAVPSGTAQSVGISGLHFSVSGGHWLNVAAGAHAYYWRVSDCMIVINSNDKSIAISRGNTNFLENYWENCDLWRPSGSTAPGFDIVNSFGGANANVWKRLRVNGQNGTGAPFFRIEADTTGTYAYDNVFEDIVGEQNSGGLIHLYSNAGAHIRNCYDWDATTAYADHVIKVDKSSTSTTESRAITITNAGRRGGTLGGSAKDCYISANARGIALNNVGNSSPSPVIQAPQKGATIVDETGLRLATGDVVQTGRNTTANRPVASTAGQGAMWFDTTLGKPIWSDGSTWRDPSGAVVVAGTSTFVADVAAAPAGSIVRFPPGVYLNPSGLGNGITVMADNVTLDLSAGAEIQVQTWGQPGIDGFNRFGLTVLGGVIRYVGTRGDHTGSYRGGALYCNGAGVYINKDRCTVDGLRTINMAQGVFLSSYNGTGWTDRIGLSNRVLNLEAEGANFGVLYVGQQALILDKLYVHDDVDDSSGTNPTHAFYGSSTATFRSRGGSITNCIAERILFGQPYQAKHHDELVMSEMVARDSRGLVNLIGCADGTLSSMVGTGCLASLVAPNGAVTVQDESTKSARMTFRDISIVIDQVGGVDQRSAVFQGSDFTIDNLSITSKRTSTGSQGNGIVQLLGNRHTLRNPRLTDTSGFNPVAILLGNGTDATSATLVDDPRISGCLRAVDTFGTSDGVIRYQNDMVSVSQAFTTTATAYTIVRDGVRVRSSTPEGAVTAPPGTTLARTDTGVLMIKGSGTGNTGWVNV